MTLHSTQRALQVFREHGGMLETSQAMALGIHPRTLYALRDAGLVEPLTRGVYRLTDAPPLEQPDLVTVALRVPRAVVCLISALALHDATSEVPHEVHIALPRGVAPPALDHPPIRVFHFSGPALSEGIEHLPLDGVQVPVYGLAKTVVDCFRFRHKLGLDVALDALQQALTRKHVQPSELLHYARLCRVEGPLRPYLEALQ